MTITLELSAEQEAKLREEAARQDVEAVRRLLTEAITPAVEALLRDPSQGQRRADGLTDEEFEALADELADMEPVPPPLPQEAFSREAIYGEHP